MEMNFLPSWSPSPDPTLELGANKNPQKILNYSQVGENFSCPASPLTSDLWPVTCRSRTTGTGTSLVFLQQVMWLWSAGVTRLFWRHFCRCRRSRAFQTVAIGAERPYGECLPANSEETQAASVLVVPSSHVETLSCDASKTNPVLESEANGPKVPRSSSDLRPKDLRPVNAPKSESWERQKRFHPLADVSDILADGA